MIEDLYNTTFGLYTDKITSTSAIGSPVRTPVLRGTHSCYITQLDGAEMVRFGKTTVEADHLLFCAIMQMGTTDLVYIAALGWFNVSYVDNANNMGHHLEVYLRKFAAPEEEAESSSSSSSSESSPSSLSSLSSETSETSPGP